VAQLDLISCDVVVRAFSLKRTGSVPASAKSFQCLRERTLHPCYDRRFAIALTIPVCIESAWLLVVFVEYAFCKSIRRPVEPALSRCFTPSESPKRLRSWRAGRNPYDLVVVETYRDDRARTDICASPLPSATPETLANDEV